MFWSNTASAETTCTFNDLGDQTCVTVNTVVAPGVTTDNLLSNDFLDGTWTGDTKHNHGNNTLAGQDGGYVNSTISLNTDAGLTKSEINSGFESTLSADIWFWNNYDQNVIMKQIITDDNGNTTTQTRTIDRQGEGYNTYSDVYIQSPNSQQDFQITSQFEFNVPNTSISQHYGADLQNPSLIVETNSSTSTTQSETFTPCFELNTCTSAGEDIANAIDLRTDDGRPIFDDLEYKVDNAVKNFEDLEEIRFVPVETMVEVEDDFGKIEEIKFEDFVEMRFTSFIVENNLVEEFKEELKVEGITEDEFFDELGGAMKEELGGDIMSDMKEFKEEEMPNDITTETRTEEIREEKIEEFNEEKTEDGDVNANTPEQPEETDTQETLQSNEEEGPNGPENENVSTKSEMDIDEKTERQAEKESADEIVEGETDISVKNKSVTVDAKVGSITEKVAKVIKKLEAKLKRVDDRLKATSYVLAVGLQSTQPDMSAYTNKRIYRNQKTIPGVIPNFFQDINILEQQQVYNNVSLAKYTDNDPLTVRRKQLIEIDAKKQKLMAEIAALRSN